MRFKYLTRTGRVRGSCSGRAACTVAGSEDLLYCWCVAAKNIFKLLSEYHRSLENMKSWLTLRPRHPSLDVERVGIVDAWQEEMKEHFRRHGFCFACNRSLSRCRCEEPL